VEEGKSSWGRGGEVVGKDREGGGKRQGRWSEKE